MVIKGILRDGSAAAETVVYPEKIDNLPVTAIRHGEADDLDLYYRDMKEVILPDTLNKIGVMAFSYCENLTRVTFPSALEKFRSAAFGNCRKLSEITLPATVTDIDYSAFEYCDQLRTVRYLGTEESFLKINTQGRDIDIYEDVFPHADVYFGQ